MQRRVLRAPRRVCARSFAMLIFFGQTTLAVAAPVYPAKHVPDYDPGTKSRPRIINQRFFNKVPDMLVSTREFWLDYKLE